MAKKKKAKKKPEPDGELRPTSSASPSPPPPPSKHERKVKKKWRQARARGDGGRMKALAEQLQELGVDVEVYKAELDAHANELQSGTADTTTHANTAPVGSASAAPSTALSLTNEIIAILHAFAESDEQTYTFPASLSKQGRSVVFDLCKSREMNSKSTGKEPNRSVTVSKRKSEQSAEAALRNMRQSFLNDFSLPPFPLESPAWEDHYMTAYDDVLGTCEKHAMLEEALHAKGGPNALLAHIGDTTARIIAAVKSVPEFELLLGKLPAVDTLAPSVSLQKHIYSPDAAGAFFIAVDMVSANFNCLRYLSPAIVLGAPDWPSLVASFSELRYVQHAKKLRQVVFGHCESKRQKKLQIHIVRRVLNHLASEKRLARAIVHENLDEVVLRSTRARVVEDVLLVERLLRQLPEGSMFRVEVFRMVHLAPQPFYVKEVFADCHDIGGAVKPVLKCISPSTLFACAYRAYRKEETTPVDRAYMGRDGRTHVHAPEDYQNVGSR